MALFLIASFQSDADETETRLAVCPFVEVTAGRDPLLGLGPTEVRVRSDLVVTVTARWSPGNQLMTIVVQRDGKTIGQAGTCWQFGDPYLGLRLEGAGFLHLYCARKLS